MIGFMPFIYPDELVYSWFCRYFVHSGYSANKMALNDLLYNRHCNPSKEFIGHLNPEMEQIIKKMYPIDKLILEHTMFPQYARFIENSKKKDALYRLGHDFCDAHHLFPIPPRCEGDQYMKYCPLCASEDRGLYGEAYWHRQHQIRNMGVCVKHKCRLENTNISAKSDHIFVLDPAEDILLDKRPIQVKNPYELDFASYVVDIFEAPVDFANDIPASAILYFGMDGTKYMSGTGRIRNTKLLADDMQEFFSKMGIADIASYYQIQRTLLGNRSDFLVVCQIAFFLEMDAGSLTNSRLSEQQLIREKNARCPQKDDLPDDWNRYDEDMAPIIEQAAHDIYHGIINPSGRPEKVTERLIKKYAGVSRHRLENMPICCEILRQYAESYDENWARRIIWAYKKLKDERQDAPVFWTDICLQAGVKKHKIHDIYPYMVKHSNKETADEIIALIPNIADQ